MPTGTAHYPEPCNAAARDRSMWPSIWSLDRQGLAQSPTGRARDLTAPSGRRMGSTRLQRSDGPSDPQSSGCSSGIARGSPWRDHGDPHPRRTSRSVLEKILLVLISQSRAVGPACCFWTVASIADRETQLRKSWNDRPIRHSIAGSIAQREFDYTRHGTVNILFFLIVHSGQMKSGLLPRQKRQALRRRS